MPFFRAAPNTEPDLRKRLNDHFGGDLASLAILSEPFQKHEHVDVHLALEKYVSQRDRTASLLGIIHQGLFGGVSLSDLLVPENPQFGRIMKEGPVKLTRIAVGDQVFSCVDCGVYLVNDNDDRLAILLGGHGSALSTDHQSPRHPRTGVGRTPRAD